jgi:hypothetical protein
MSHPENAPSPNCKKLKFEALLGIAGPLIAVVVLALIILFTNQ